MSSSPLIELDSVPIEWVSLNSSPPISVPYTYFLKSHPCKHDVYLSFSDTRMGFTGHLCDDLTRQGINTFMEGDLSDGEVFEAIAASRIAIVVLSSGHATSTWCLDELAYIVDCKEKMELIVIPVFYHVDQRNTFEEAFANHERSAPEKVKTWRDALTKVGDIPGWHVQGTGYESEVKIISSIVRTISMILQDIDIKMPKRRMTISRREPSQLFDITTTFWRKTFGNTIPPKDYTISLKDLASFLEAFEEDPLSDPVILWIM